MTTGTSVFQRRPHAYDRMQAAFYDIGGATPKFFGGPNLLPTTDVLQATAYKPQHWDWGQTEITSPIFTLYTLSY